MSTSADILAEIRASAKALKIAPTTLCQRAVKNGRLVARLENGETVTLRTIERIRAHVAAALASAA